jgi:hypothetical protein
MFFSKVVNYKLLDSLPCLPFISLTNIDFTVSIYSAGKHFYAVAHYATSLKAAGFRPDDVNFVNLLNPSGRTRPWGLISL